MSAAATRLLQGFVAPLDAVRAAGLRLLGRRMAGLLRDRRARITLASCAAVLMAFIAALLDPLLLLTVGPLVLGVPHLLADVRYLVVQPGLHRRWAWVLAVAPWLVWLAFAPSVVVALCALAASALVSRSAWRAKLGVACGALALAWLCSRVVQADVYFAHAHNLLALAFWVCFARGDRRHVAPALGLFALASLVIFTLPLASLLSGLQPASHFRIDTDRLAREVSPTSDGVWALRALVFFAFAQSVHYAVWTRLVPEEARPRETPRTFAATMRALRGELGTLVTFVFVALAVYVSVRGACSPGVMRADYMRFAYLHGPLELCAGALLLLERSR